MQRHTSNLHLVDGSNGNGSQMAPMHERVIRKLETIGQLSDSDREGIRTLTGTVRQLRPYEDIVSEGDRPSAVCAMLSGLACRYKILEDGRRQIMSFHIAGDVPDLQSLFLKKMDHSLGTLVDTTVVHIPHETMLDVFARAPNLGYLFWRGTLIEAAIFREWMVGLGRRQAYERLAHMLCEIMTQMKSIELCEGDTCELPLTQAEIADATGMSTVHTNRTLQELRANHLISFRAGSLTVLDWDGLREAGAFDPAYLHLRTDTP